MTDPKRLLDSADPRLQRVLGSAAGDRPSPRAARATLVALGLTGPAVAAAAPAGAAAYKGTLAVLLGTATAKVVAAVTAAVVAGSVVVAVAPTRPRPAPAPVAIRPATTFSAESALLKSAAGALAAHQPGAALEALDQHQARYPNGLLAEEAAALRVEALAARGDLPAAQQALERFNARYPDSPFVPVINPPATGDESVQAEHGDKP